MFAIALAVGALIQVPAASGEAEPSPAWTVEALAAPTNFVPGDGKGRYLYEVFLTNVGAAATDDQDPITVFDALPAGVLAKQVELELPQGGPDLGPGACQIEAAGTAVSCSLQAALGPGESIRLGIRVAPPPEAGTLVNLVQVSGGGGRPAGASARNEASAEPASAGLQAFEATLTEADGSRAGVAGSSPQQLTIGFALNLVRGPAGSGLPVVAAEGDPKDVEVVLPAGLVGDVTATARCTAKEFNDVQVLSVETGEAYVNECPDSSAVGTISLRQLQGLGAAGRVAPLYSLVPPPGMPAQLGFQILGLPIYLDTAVRRIQGEYVIVASLRNLSQSQRVTAAQLTLWGTPAAASHDHLRGRCAETGGSCPAGQEPKPLLRLPTSCASPLLTTIGFDTWSNPGAFLSAAREAPAPSACGLLGFSPSFMVAPTSAAADSPTGLRFDLHTPPGAVGEADLRAAAFDLPDGLTINPAAVDGLAVCSLAQVDLASIESPRCPAASKLGTLEVTTPLLGSPLTGFVYAAQQGSNPFGSTLAVYLVVDDPATGVVLKLAGELSADPGSGLLTGRFGDLPELPVDRLRIELFDGPRAALRTPAWCGPHLARADLVPWGAPGTSSASATSAFSIDSSPVAGSCPSSAAELPPLASFEAGTSAPEAGKAAALLIRVTRPDGAQPLTGFGAVLPPGLTARLAGTAECSAAEVAQAESRDGAGEAALEREHPSCPAASRVGWVQVGVGAGSHPLHLAGDAYLSGPWEGSPASLAIVVPADAGAFDLGAIVVRVALDVDRESGRLRAQSDRLPTVVAGVAVGLRDLRIGIDRPGFIHNPTRCAPTAVTGTVSSPLGARPVASRFQVGGCRSLGFDPRLSLRLSGPPRRGAHPRIEAVLRDRSGGANLRRLALVLPGSLLLDSRRIQGVCGRRQHADGGCPPGSAVGFARARTPLLDTPLEGRVYLRESKRRLPELLVALRGRIGIDLIGHLDAVDGRLRATFEDLPDLPFGRLELTLLGGRRGIFVTSGGVCRDLRARVALRGQNDRAKMLRPLVSTRCGRR